MLKPRWTSQFRKDLERMKKRGADLDRLKSVMMTIAREERLDSRYRPHRLKGKYQGAWECHLKHD